MFSGDILVMPIDKNIIMCKNGDNGALQLYTDGGYVSGMSTGGVLRPAKRSFRRRDLPAVKGKEENKRVSLSISRETKVMLDSVKHPGQSYNGLLQELVTSWKKQREMEGKGVS